MVPLLIFLICLTDEGAFEMSDTQLFGRSSLKGEEFAQDYYLFLTLIRAARKEAK